MLCTKYKSYISLYIDGELKASIQHRLISHLDKCPSCKMEYEQLLEVRNILGKLEEHELPKVFNQNLHIKLVEEENNMNRKKLFWPTVLGAGVGILAVLIIIFSVNGVTLKSNHTKMSESSGRERADMVQPQEEGSAPESPETDRDYAVNNDAKEGIAEDTTLAGIAEIDRKLIKTAHIIVETLEFDSTVSGVIAKTNMMQGYVQSSSIEGISRQRSDKSKRHADFVIRIPTKSLEKFTESLEGIGDITHREIYADDITAEYFDTEARLKSLEIQEDRLLAILSKAEKLQDIIELERELSKVRYEIENFTGTLKKWDNLVDYSTVHLSVLEVEQLKPELEGGFGERVSKGFMRSIKNLGKFFENMFAGIIIWSPYILILGALLWLVKIFIVNHRKNKDESKRNE